MEKEIKRFKELDYVFTCNEDFDTAKKYPVIIHLHGAGGRGRDINLLLDHSFFRGVEEQNTDVLTFSPQCYAESWFDIFEQLQEFIKYVIDLDYVDKSRVYITGASMGGYTVWQMIMTHPEWFAAAVPVCGGGMYWLAYRLKNVPIWAFHGDRDDCVYTEESKKMVDAVNRNGGNAKLTICEDTGHDVWLKAYFCDEMYKWMLSKRLNMGEEGKNQFNDLEKFG